MKVFDIEECSILNLVVNRRWYDMISYGTKCESYRQVNDYYVRKIQKWISKASRGYVRERRRRRGLARERHLVVAFSTGYSTPDLYVECKTLEVRSKVAHPEWGEIAGSHYVIGLGQMVVVNGVKLCRSDWERVIDKNRALEEIPAMTDEELRRLYADVCLERKRHVNSRNGQFGDKAFDDCRIVGDAIAEELGQRELETVSQGVRYLEDAEYVSYLRR